MDVVGTLVRLRALRPDDAQGIAANVADPEVVRYLGNWSWNPHTVEDAREFIGRHEPGQVVWAVESLDDGVFLGTTSLHEINPRDRHCHWGIVLGPPSRWGRGYGTETCRLATSWAFQHLGLEKVYLEVYEGNDRGRRAYEKAGYRLEGTLERHTWLDGRLATAYLMAAYRGDPLYV